MRSFSFLLVAACLIVSSGCVRTVLVYSGQDREDKIRGIPFYIKRTVSKQTTAYRRSYLRVSFQATEIVPTGQNSPPAQVPYPALVRNVENNATSLAAIAELRAALNADDVDLEKAVAAFGKLVEVPDVKLLPWEAKPVSNNVALVSEVDYSQRYYINARAPWFGSGSLNAQLNEDGTLTSAEATVTPTVADGGISSLVPFKEYFESKYVTVPAGDAAPAGAPFAGQRLTRNVNLKFSVSVDEQAELLALEKILVDNNRSPMPITLPADLATTDVPFTIRAAQAGGAAAAPQNAWTVSGSLTPPKPQQGAGQ